MHESHPTRMSWFCDSSWPTWVTQVFFHKQVHKQWPRVKFCATHVVMQSRVTNVSQTVYVSHELRHELRMCVSRRYAVRCNAKAYVIKHVMPHELYVQMHTWHSVLKDTQLVTNYACEFRGAMQSDVTRRHTSSNVWWLRHHELDLSVTWVS